MTDKLEWKDIDLMSYIATIESIYIPDLEEYKYRMNVTHIPASKEDIESIWNIPFGATPCMIVFKDRYNTDSIVKKFTYKDYIEDDNIQELVQYLELDSDKFWLLIVFTYDYCTSMFYQGITMKHNPLEQLEQLVSMIEQASEPMTLCFKSGKMKTTLDDSHALKFIADSIRKCVDEADMDTIKYLSRRIQADEADELKDSPFIAYFAKMILRFFDMQPQIRNKRKKGAKHSTKEMELVSILVYFTKLSRNESWFCPEERYLKSFLKQYKDFKYPNNISNVYPEFYC